MWQPQCSASLVFVIPGRCPGSELAPASSHGSWHWMGRAEWEEPDGKSWMGGGRGVKGEEMRVVKYGAMSLC